MRVKLVSVLILSLLTFGCGSSVRSSGAHNGNNSKAYTLSSGKQVKVSGVAQMNFPHGPSALVLNYETDISIEDRKTLRREVDEIWKVFQKDVEQAQLKVGIIRATYYAGSSAVRSGKGYGFVFEKREDGEWHCLEDDNEKKKS
jgi:hypothetical protein